MLIHFAHIWLCNKEFLQDMRDEQHCATLVLARETKRVRVTTALLKPETTLNLVKNCFHF